MNKYTFNKAEEDYEKASSEYISARTEGSYNSCWRSSPELSFGCLEKYKERLESKKNKYNELRKERNIEIEKELKDVEKSRGTVVSAEIFLDNYIKKEEAKEAADKAEAERLAKEAAEKAEAERLAKEAADKAEAEEKVRQEAEARAEAEKFTEEEAEKLISEAKAIIAIARHEREVVNPELIKLTVDKKLKELELHLKSARDIRISEKVILNFFKEFIGEYNLKEGSEILSQFNTAKEEITTESKEQLSFIAELKESIKLIKIDNEEILKNIEIKEDVIQEEINPKTTEYHDHGSEL